MCCPWSLGSFFSNFVTDSDLARIAGADDCSVVQQVHEYYADYYAINPDFFSLNYTTTVHKNREEMQAIVDRSCAGISALLLSLKKKPYIRFQKTSDLAKGVVVVVVVVAAAAVVVVVAVVVDVDVDVVVRARALRQEGAMKLETGHPGCDRHVRALQWVTYRRRRPSCCCQRRWWNVERPKSSRVHRRVSFVNCAICTRRATRAQLWR